MGVLNPEDADAITDRISAALGRDETPERETLSLNDNDAPTNDAPTDDSPDKQVGHAREDTTTRNDTRDDSDDDYEPEPTRRRLADIADQLGVDISELYNTEIAFTNAAGTQQIQTLGEWKDRAQDLSMADRLKTDSQTSWQAASEAMMHSQENSFALKQAAVESTALVDALEQQFMGQYAQIDWAKLRAENPTEFAVLSLEAQNRRQELAAHRAQAQQQWAAAMESEQQTQQFLDRGIIEYEERVLQKEIPDWNESAGKKTVEYLIDNYGLTPKQLSANRSASNLVLANKARLWDEFMAKGGVAKKKLLKTPKKVLRPGSRTTVAKTDGEASLKQTLRRTGHTDDAAKLIQKRLGR